MGSCVGLDPVFLISSVIGIHLLQRPFCMCTCRMQDVKCSQILRVICMSISQIKNIWYKRRYIYLYNYQFPSVTLVTGSHFLFTIFANLLCLRFLDSSALLVFFVFFFLPVTILCHLLPPHVIHTNLYTSALYLWIDSEITWIWITQVYEIDT